MSKTYTAISPNYPYIEGYGESTYIDYKHNDKAKKAKYKARFRENEWTPVAIAGESIDGRTVTRKFLEKVATNYKPEKNGIKAKIKLGHRNPLLPEGKAYGYFSELRISKSNADILEGKPEWVHEELTEKLETGEYRDISPEFRPIIKNTGKTDDKGNPIYELDYYFGGVAVLGESHPAFPSLSIDFESGKLPNLSYKSDLIKIEQINHSNGDKYNINNELNAITIANYEQLKLDYQNLLEKNKKITAYYSNTLNTLKEELKKYKCDDRKDKVIAFCKQSLREGKIKPYELMKEKPSDTIAESGLLKHLLSLSDEQMKFEMNLIKSREVNNRFKPLIEPDTQSSSYNFDVNEELEERLFLDFCNKNNFDLNCIKDIDKAYKDWRNNVKH